MRATAAAKIERFPSAPPPHVSKRERMPNPLRSARTKQRLLDATVDCLYELGYDRTSTVLVTKRAGVSRGAMLHQFPSKADLMMAVSEHICQRRKAAHREALDHLADPREKLRKLVDITWNELITPSGIARIEIMLASRSDPEFGPRFAKLNAEMEHRHKAWLWSLAQEAGVTNKPMIEAMAQLYSGALRGLAIDNLQEASRPGVEAAVNLLRRYQNEMLDSLFDGGPNN